MFWLFLAGIVNGCALGLLNVTQWSTTLSEISAPLRSKGWYCPIEHAAQGAP
jgi:hypothetical protein